MTNSTPAANEVTLKPCLCGQPARAIEHDDLSNCWRVECTECTIRTGDFAHRRRAETEWNTRPASAEAPAGVFGRTDQPNVMVYTMEMARGIDGQRIPFGYHQVVMLGDHQRALDKVKAEAPARVDAWVPWQVGDVTPAPGQYCVLAEAWSPGSLDHWPVIAKVLPADNMFQNRWDWHYTSKIIAYLPRPLPPLAARLQGTTGEVERG